MHPKASRLLFDEAVTALRANQPLLSVNGWEIVSAAFPVLLMTIRQRTSGKARTFRFDCTDWNEQPPSLTIADPATGLAEPGEQWPRDGGTGHWHQSGHSAGNGPFICMPGMREYHTHSSHINDVWDNYRGRAGFSLIELILKVSTSFHKAHV